MTRALILGLSLLALAGCQTYERQNGKEYRVRDEQGLREDPREQQLLELAEEKPDQPDVWFALGDYYERQLRFVPAYRAYLRMQECIEKVGSEQGTVYLGGYFRLARISYRAKDYKRALKWLKKILAHEPKTAEEAILNKNFRETHLMLAWIYHHTKQTAKALREARAFKTLGGDGRADGIFLAAEEDAPQVPPKEGR